MGMLNLAHGAMFMVAAYVGWTVAVELDLHYSVAVLLGGLAASLVGLAIERGLLRHLYRQLNEQVVVTIGCMFIITNLTQWVWGGVPRAPYTGFSGSFPIGDMMYPIHRVVTIGIGLSVFFALRWLLDKTRFGRIIRAGMEDREMVTGLGVNLGRITYLSFALGSFLAGIAGVVGAQTLGA